MKPSRIEDPQSGHTLLKVLSDNRNENEKCAPKFWLSKRFLVSILMFFGTLHAGAMVANLSIAIVEMTSSKTIQFQNETIIEEPEFDWDPKMKGFILGLYSYGFTSSFFVSNLSMKIGGATMIGIAVGFTAIMTLLTPVIIRFNFYLYMVVRILEGAFEGLGYVSYSEVWSKWAPIQDRSKLLSIGFSGFYVGPVITYPACGFIIHKFGWPAAFYVTGGSSLLWCLLWLTCVSNNPESDRWISKEEVKYIKENQVQINRPRNVLSVWKGILTSKCIWVLCICKLGYTFGHALVVKCFPMYLKDITNSEIHKIGIFSALPNTLCIPAVPLTGYLVDSIQNKKILNSTQVHKAFMCSGYAIGAAVLFCISLLRPSFTITMLCFVIFKLMLSLNFVIITVSCISLAPQCASLVAGTMATCQSIGAIISLMFIGFLVADHSPEQWNLCIALIGVILLAAALSFLLWGSGDPQPWSYSTDEDQHKYDECDQSQHSRS